MPVSQDGPKLFCAHGLVVQSASLLIPSAFLAKAAGSSNLTRQVLPSAAGLQEAHCSSLSVALTLWTSGHDEPPPSALLPLSSRSLGTILKWHWHRGPLLQTDSCKCNCKGPPSRCSWKGVWSMAASLPCVLDRSKYGRGDPGDHGLGVKLRCPHVRQHCQAQLQGQTPLPCSHQ